MPTLEDDFGALLDSVNRLEPAQVYADRDGLRERLEELDRARRALAHDDPRRPELDKRSMLIDAVITVKVHRHTHPLVTDRQPQPPAPEHRRDRGIRYER